MVPAIRRLALNPRNVTHFFASTGVDHVLVFVLELLRPNRDRVRTERRGRLNY